MAECRFDSGKKSEFSRRKPRTKFNDSFESLSWRRCAFAFSMKFDKNEFLDDFTSWLLAFEPHGWDIASFSMRRCSASTTNLFCAFDWLSIFLLASTTICALCFGLFAAAFACDGCSGRDCDGCGGDIASECGFLARLFEKKRSMSHSSSNTVSASFSVDDDVLAEANWFWFSIFFIVCARVRYSKFTSEVVSVCGVLLMVCAFYL